MPDVTSFHESGGETSESFEMIDMVTKVVCWDGESEEYKREWKCCEWCDEEEYELVVVKNFQWLKHSSTIATTSFYKHFLLLFSFLLFTERETKRENDMLLWFPFTLQLVYIYLCRKQDRLTLCLHYDVLGDPDLLRLKNLWFNAVFNFVY
jgi:hypothetical protein